jgi:inositol phosphorylceramide mannosyltransferase catalytic subunit
VIPRIFHQIWVGPNPTPQEFLGYRESWLRHHPGWEMRLWTEENLPTDLVRKEAHERLRNPAERADIIRLEVLLRCGGVYVDTDLECLRSIEPLLEGLEFCLTGAKSGRVSTALIGARPRHPIIERALRELRPRTEYGVDKKGTGGIFFNRLIRQYPEVTIFPSEYFHAFAPGERAYAVNHRARSWMEPEQFRRALVKAELKLADAQDRIEELERRAVWRRWKNLASLFAARSRRSFS